MVGAQNVPVPSQAAISRSRAQKSSDTGWLFTLLLILVGVGAIVGILVTVSMGLTNVALAIGIIGCAFFARAFC